MVCGRYATIFEGTSQTPAHQERHLEFPGSAHYYISTPSTPVQTSYPNVLNTTSTPWTIIRARQGDGTCLSRLLGIDQAKKHLEDGCDFSESTNLETALRTLAPTLALSLSRGPTELLGHPDEACALRPQALIFPKLDDDVQPKEEGLSACLLFSRQNCVCGRL